MLDRGTPVFNRRSFVGGAAAFAASALIGCGSKVKAPHYVLPGKDVTGAGSLREHAANAKLLFGFAVNTQMLRDNAVYRRTVQEQCSIIVAENAMKWRALHPGPDQYRFEEADALLTFAETSRIKLRGHNLCWHDGLPDWSATTAMPANARTILTDHIRTVAGRYAGRMHSWDVVNEAVEVRDGRPDGLRNSPWLKLAGSDYIEVAFRTAREADPSALLTYNEYGIEQETQQAAEKRAATLLLLRRLKQRNVPIDGVGVQSHITAHSLYGYGPSLVKFIESCREMDLQVLISEMDVNDRELPGNIDARDAAVSEQYRSYLQTVLAARNVTGVLTWGVDDGQTWLNSGDHARRDHQPQRPLLFDAELRPKPAFAAVREAFNARYPVTTPAVQPVRSVQRKLPKL